MVHDAYTCTHILTYMIHTPHRPPPPTIRPIGEQSYLMIGLDDSDADTRGVNDIVTAIEMAEDAHLGTGPGGPKLTPSWAPASSYSSVVQGSGEPYGGRQALPVSRSATDAAALGSEQGRHAQGLQFAPTQNPGRGGRTRVGGQNPGREGKTQVGGQNPGRGAEPW